MTHGPLTGCRVLLTRPTTSASSWHAAFTAAGAAVVDFPTTFVGPPPSWAALDEAFVRIDTYDWLIFTSAAAAQLACARLPSSFVTGATTRPRVAAVGTETARALALVHVQVALVPRDQSQDGLIAAFSDPASPDFLVAGMRVLFPRALGGLDRLPEFLRSRAVHVDVVPASQTVARRDLLPPPPFDVATFASPSALAAFADRLGVDRLLAAACVVIGATTAGHARSLGLSPVVARAPHADAVIEAIAGAWRR